jgi:hypothetical protein
LGMPFIPTPRKFLKLGGVSDDVVGDVPVPRVPSAIGTPLPVSKVAESSSQGPKGASPSGDPAKGPKELGNDRRLLDR